MPEAPACGFRVFLPPTSLAGGRESRERCCFCASCTFEMKVPAAPLCSMYGSFPGEKGMVQVAFSTKLKVDPARQLLQNLGKEIEV